MPVKKSDIKGEAQVAEWATAVKGTGLDFVPASSFHRPQMIPTMYAAFNKDVLKCGGIPRGGRWTQLYGPEHGGKSTLALHLVAMAQRTYPTEMVAYLDSEYKFDPEWAVMQGVDLDRLFLHQTNIAEEAFDWTVKVVASGVVSLLVIDSIGNIAPHTIFGSDQWDRTKEGERKHKPRPGHTAGLETEWVYSLSKSAKDNNVAVIPIAQIRDKIGVIYGSSEIATGAHALKHILTINARVSHAGDVVDATTKEIIGFKARIKIGKNGLGTKAETNESTHLVFYNEGTLKVARLLELRDILVEKELLTRSGAWWRLMENGEVKEKWNSWALLVKALTDNEELRNEFERLAT